MAKSQGPISRPIPLVLTVWANLCSWFFGGGLHQVLPNIPTVPLRCIDLLWTAFSLCQSNWLLAYLENYSFIEFMAHVLLSIWSYDLVVVYHKVCICNFSSRVASLPGVLAGGIVSSRVAITATKNKSLTHSPLLHRWAHWTDLSLPLHVASLYAEPEACQNRRAKGLMRQLVTWVTELIREVRMALAFLFFFAWH